MQKLTFATEPHFALAAALLAKLPATFTGGIDSQGRTIEVADPAMALLLARVTNKSSTVLPIIEDGRDRWLLMASDRYAAERAWGHVSRFVLPSFGAFPTDMQSGSFCSFAAPSADLPMAIAAGFGGYIEWHAPPHERQTVLRQLRLWANADAKRPSLALDRPPTYPKLFADFTSALATMNWADATSALGEMRRLHLTNFDNLAFLRLQLLAQQGKWVEIWEDRTFAVMAAQQLPRLVRTALIEAFHQTSLLKFEQADDFDGALLHFRDNQARLGMLLTGRFSSTNSAVLRVFALQAAAEQDRETLEQISLSPAIDTAAQRVVAALRTRLPAPLQAIEPAAVRLQQAMRQRNYDKAATAALELETAIERTVALLRIAYRHPDAGELALTAYDALNAEEIQLLEEEEPSATFYLQHILNVTQNANPEIGSWPAWFERLLTAPNDPALESAIDRLSQQADDRLWTSDSVRAIVSKFATLFDQDDSLLGSRVTQRGVNTFIDLVLADKEFPRPGQEYADLVEASLDWMVLSSVVNEADGKKLLRLADANLRFYPTRVKQIAKELCTWFERPTLALEELLLGAFDLLISNGAGRQEIFDTFREWLGHLLDLPSTTSWPHTNKEIWLSIGEWVQPGGDLLETLRDHFVTVTADVEVSALSRIPKGYRIAIFTLNPMAARRASAIIRQRNPLLEVEICSDTVLTESAQRLATRADVPVIVASCLTHALFYGIKPHLQIDPVYPTFQGATSIVRALEDFANRL